MKAAFLAAALVLVLGGCSSPKPAATPEQTTRMATVDSVRKLQPEGSRAGAVEIIVRLDSGERRAIVQDADAGLKEGQRVTLMTSGGVTRITP